MMTGWWRGTETVPADCITAEVMVNAKSVANEGCLYPSGVFPMRLPGQPPKGEGNEDIQSLAKTSGVLAGA